MADFNTLTYRALSISLLSGNYDFTTMGNRITAVEAALATLQTGINTLTTNLAAELAARAAADATLTTNLGTEATTRGAADTSLVANLNAESAARIAGDANGYTPTTDNMTLVAYKNYSLQANHTVNFPPMVNNTWINLEPANGDWPSINATFVIPNTWAFSPATLTGIDPKKIVTFIGDFTNSLIRVRQ